MPDFARQNEICPEPIQQWVPPRFLSGAGLEQELVWPTIIDWVDANLALIAWYAKPLRTYLPIESFVELRHHAYMVGVETLLTLLSKGRLDRFLPEFKGRLKESLRRMSSGVPTVEMDDLENHADVAESIPFLPGFPWPTSLPQSLAEKAAFPNMKEHQRNVWCTYLYESANASEAIEALGVSKTAIFKNLNKGIKQVLSRRCE